MCGRFALSLNTEEIDRQLKEMQLHVDSWLNQNDYQPNFNIAPQNKAAVVRRAEPKETRLEIDCMKWGLIAHWTESPPTYGTLLNTINARDDRVIEPRGLWNSVKHRKRCIVLCEGFFEWLTKGKEKIPHFTKRTDGKLMCLAGLWDSVTYKGSKEELRTFTIITTSSNKYLSFLHDRMPVILPDLSSMEMWLDTSSLEWSISLTKLLKPFEDPDGLLCYPVPKEVGKVGTQSADFLKPVSERKGNIMSFFKVQAEKKTQASLKGKQLSSDECKNKQQESKSSSVLKSIPSSSRKELNHVSIIKDELIDLPDTESKNTSHKRPFSSMHHQTLSSSPKKKSR